MKLYKKTRILKKFQIRILLMPAGILLGKICCRGSGHLTIFMPESANKTFRVGKKQMATEFFKLDFFS